MYRHPRTIKQLNKRLEYEIVEVFPFGKYKDKLVKGVVKGDPNYIVWWHENIKGCPLDKQIVQTAYNNYVTRRGNGGYWTWPEAHWDGDVGDYEDLMGSPEGVLGDPWDPSSPF